MSNRNHQDRNLSIKAGPWCEISRFLHIDMVELSASFGRISSGHLFFLKSTRPDLAAYSRKNPPNPSELRFIVIYIVSQCHWIRFTDVNGINPYKVSCIIVFSVDEQIFVILWLLFLRWKCQYNYLCRDFIYYGICRIFCLWTLNVMVNKRTEHDQPGL